MDRPERFVIIIVGLVLAGVLTTLLTTGGLSFDLCIIGDCPDPGPPPAQDQPGSPIIGHKIVTPEAAGGFQRDHDTESKLADQVASFRVTPAGRRPG
jgi:hypothetical protein